MNEFYILRQSSKLNSVELTNNLNYHECISLIRDEVDNDLQLNREIIKEGSYLDLINGGSVSLYLLSSRFINLFLSLNASGWKSRRVTIGSSESEYSVLSILGRSGSIDYSKGVSFKKQLVVNGPIATYYRGIEIEDWDGSDLFMNDETLHIFVTERIKKEIQERSLTGVELVHVSDYEFSDSLYKEKRKKRFGLF